jgi:hypothetical protein
MANFGSPRHMVRLADHRRARRDRRIEALRMEALRHAQLFGISGGRNAADAPGSSTVHSRIDSLLNEAPHLFPRRITGES